RQIFQGHRRRSAPRRRRTRARRWLGDGCHYESAAMPNREPEDTIAYLRQHKLRLTTAESCTAGKIIQLLANVPGCGSLMDCGYVVYSVQAKKRLLNVSQDTIDRCNLSSEAVAREMAEGALLDSTANAAIATTGVAGPEPMDGIPPGTVCFAWGFQRHALRIFTQTRHFEGDRE